MEEKQLEATIEVKEKDNSPLSEQYAKFEIEPMIMGKNIVYEYGTKSLTKILKFQEKTGFGNNEIDYYMGIQPERQKGEVKEFDDDGKLKNDMWKNRQKFQQVLYKFRKYIYEFPETLKEKARRLLKEEKGTAYAD